MKQNENSQEQFNFQEYRLGKTMMKPLLHYIDAFSKADCTESFQEDTFYGRSCYVNSRGRSKTYVFPFPEGDETRFLSALSTQLLKERTYKESFSDIVSAISPRFEEIFNEAMSAYSLEMLHVCGGGFRKALEILVIDYAIYENPEKREEILRIGQLANIVKQYLSETDLAIDINAASWLGNDRLHYSEKFPEQSIDDLISFIRDVVQTIELREKRKKKMEEMPDLKKIVK